MEKESRHMDLKKITILSATSGLLLGGLLTYLYPEGQWWIGLISSVLLISVSIFLLLLSVKFLGGEKTTLALTLTAFLSRLLVGVLLMMLLPEIGYDTDQQNAGYLFQDAYARDTAAWKLAASEDSVFTVFNAEFFEDQYGGLSFLSAITYRFLSPDAHRPSLVLILSSFVFAVGVSFFHAALTMRWNSKMAKIVAWLLVLYPEGIFYTVSQMREPFVIGVAMVLFWCVVQWFERSKRTYVYRFALSSVLFMLLISWRTGMGVLLILGGWFWIEYIIQIDDQQKRRKLWFVFIAMLVLGFISMGIITGKWLRVSIWWDMREMMVNSGLVAFFLEDAPELIQWGFITVYGIFQVVLPAAVIDTAAPFWKGITIMRSAGWYLLLPLLLYGLYAVWRQKDRSEKLVMLWFIIISWGWIVFSSLRAGGDMWDNPRYRTVFLPFFMILVVMIWKLRDHWLWRVASIEGFALLVFTQWYLSRHQFFSWHLPMAQMIGVILAFSAIIIGTGVYHELKERRRSKLLIQN